MEKNKNSAKQVDVDLLGQIFQEDY